MSRSVSRHWQRARAYLQQRNLAAAQVQLESLLALAPDDARTRLLAARMAWHVGHPRDAAEHALAASRVADDDVEVLGELVEVLLQAGESAAAHDLLGRSIWEQVEAPDALLRYADQQRRLGQHAEALAAFDRLVGLRPNDGTLYRHRGQQREFVGRLQEAESDYLKCLALDPGHARAAYSLVRLRRQSHDDNHLALVESCLARVRPGSQQHADFEFARYHVLEDLGQFDAAWRSLATANAGMHAYAAADAARELEGMRCFRELVKAHPPREVSARHEGAQPIFILGLPRSGTTVLERMLANHPQVASAGELTDFGRQLLRAGNTVAGWDGDFFTRQLQLDFAEVGRGYLAQTAWRAGVKPFYVDKRPGHYMVAGLIHAALPEARILHLVRDPMDACFSIWRARFGNTYAWSYDFRTLAAHYDEYRRLMDVWHAQYPGAIMDVSYADLVHHSTATLDRVLDFCGLARESGCADLTRNAGPVSTLSSAQVREPVHARSLGLWQRYAAPLQPLRDLLPASPGVPVAP